MAKYTVEVYFTATYGDELEIEASSEDEAVEKAREVLEGYEVDAEALLGNCEADIGLVEVVR